MKNLIPLAAFLLSTSVLSATVQDFAGDFKLVSGSENCYETLQNRYLDEDKCLVLYPKNSGMNWSPTQKICNINEGVQTSKEDIPSIMYVGDIIHTDYALLADTMITSDDTLYSGSVQQVIYNTGKTYYQSDELFLTTFDSETLHFRHVSVDKELLHDDETKSELTVRECIYKKN